MSLKFKSVFLPFVLIGLFCVFPAFAQIEIKDDEVEEIGPERPRTGKKAAQEYFLKRKDTSEQPSPTKNGFRSTSSAVSSAGPRYLTLHLGTFFDEESYSWGQRNDDELAELNAGVTYRIGEWVNSMDLSFRADFTSYDMSQGKAVKMSLLPVITFPDARSLFPLYFGAGAGLGVFFKQVDDESHVSLDYQLFAGARLFNLVENMGFLAEAGIKNHFLLLSDGQYNGAFFALGVVFDF